MLVCCFKALLWDLSPSSLFSLRHNLITTVTKTMVIMMMMMKTTTTTVMRDDNDTNTGNTRFYLPRPELSTRGILKWQQCVTWITHNALQTPDTKIQYVLPPLAFLFVCLFVFDHSFCFVVCAFDCSFVCLCVCFCFWGCLLLLLLLFFCLFAFFFFFGGGGVFWQTWNRYTFSLSIVWNHLPMKKGSSPEYPEKTPTTINKRCRLHTPKLMWLPVVTGVVIVQAEACGTTTTAVRDTAETLKLTRARHAWLSSPSPQGNRAG